MASQYFNQLKYDSKGIQWGSEFRTPKYRKHSKTRQFKAQFFNALTNLIPGPVRSGFENWTRIQMLAPTI